MVVLIKVRRNVCLSIGKFPNDNLDGLMSYSIPDGDRRGYTTQFFDEIYDGKKDHGWLRGSNS